MKIYFLIDKNYSQNSFAFIYPILINKKYFNEKIFFSDKIPNNNYDVILVDSKFFYKKFKENNTQLIKKIIQELKLKCKKLVYVDNEASIFINKNIIEIFDYYLKGRIPNDKNIYKKKLYGLREFTEFYHHKFNIKDDNEVYSEYLNEKDISKIILSWNNGICNYSFWSKINRNIFKLSNFVFNNIKCKDYEKRQNFSARFAQSYLRQTVDFQRKKLSKLINNAKLTNRVSRYRYFNELKRSKISFSPFGWGEICYRDFESFYYKCALVKPNMDHINTWPKFYIKNTTYLSLNWDFSNFENIIHYINDKKNENNLNFIADKGQKKYFYHLSSGEDSPFVLHFNDILKRVLL